jgi:hypothetical protein
MADPDAIADRAMELASKFLETDSREIADMADGKPEVLRLAARILGEQPHTETRASLGPEHLAFTLITAAYDELLQRRRPDA